MTVNAPLLSLCMIVRDSAATLPACLASVRDWVDELIVVDTGSLDATREIARQFGAQVFDFPWIDDFSAARNESLTHATGEWLFWMDSDDTIDAANGKKLKELAAGSHPDNTHGYVLQVHCPSPSPSGDEVTVVDHVKLVRNDPRIRFEGRIHEQVLPSIRRLGGEIGWTEVFVVHSGSDQSPLGKQRKYERDLRILQLDLQERPEHPFVLFNMGMTLADMQRPAEAEHWLRRSLAASQPKESHVRKAYALLAAVLHQQGRQAESLEHAHQALARFPQDVEILFRKAMLFHEDGQFEGAISAYRTILQAPANRHFKSLDSGLCGYKTRHNLATIHGATGRHDLAELQWRRVCEERPANRHAARALGQSLLEQGKATTLDVFLEALDSQPTTKPDALWLRAQRAEKHGQQDRARSYLEQALQLDSEHLPAWQDRARWLFHYGGLDEAATALQELSTRIPDDPAVLHNLGVVQLRQGKLADAVESLEKSLQIRPDSETTRQELERTRERIASKSTVEPFHSAIPPLAVTR